MTENADTTLGVLHDEALAQEWELVLLAQGLSPRMHWTPEGIVLTVPSAEGAQALAELAAYERENPPKALQSAPAVAPVQVLAGTLVGFALFEFFAVTVLWHTALPWMQRGSAQASRILEGEWWRSVTALTLHANLPHALSNALAIAVFFGAAAGQMGAGAAGMLILLAGAGGNVANALWRGALHTSVGASTAIFGAVGMLGSLALLQRRHTVDTRRRAWVAVAAALALLGMLGTGSGRVDVVAHLLGFLVGSVLGLLMAVVCPSPPGPIVQWTCGSATVGVLVYCWILALGV